MKAACEERATLFGFHFGFQASYTSTFRKVEFS
jgi:hypothetical protein